MSKRTVLIFMVVLATLSLRAYSQVKVGQTEVPDTGKMTRAIKLSTLYKGNLVDFLVGEGKRWKDKAGALDKGYAEFKAKTTNITINDPKYSEVLEEYLTDRMSKVEDIKGDVEFVANKFTESVVKMNAIVGELGKESELARKAAKAEADTSKKKEEIKSLQREYRGMQTSKPKAGTPEYIPWFRKKRRIQNEFTQAQERFVTSVRLSVYYAYMADTLKMSAENSGNWQDYLMEVTSTLDTQKYKLQSEYNLLKDFKAATEVGKEFRDAVEMGKRLREAIKELAGVVSGPIPGLPPLPIAPPPPPPPGGDITTIDPDAIEKDLIKQMKSALQSKRPATEKKAPVKKGTESSKK